jgi:pyrroline-5-carboxylate reductase
MNISIIGFGTMGRMITEAILSSHPEYQRNIFIYNRSPERVLTFLDKYHEVRQADTPSLAARNSSIIFLCVKPSACPPMLSEISQVINKDAHLISIAADVSLAEIGTVFRGKISRLLPTAATEVKSGATISCHNSAVTGNDKNTLSRLFADSVKFYDIPENEFDAITNITSCGPGLLAKMLDLFAGSQAGMSELSSETIREMLIETLFGICLMVKQKNNSFSDIIGKVATKGGITEAGISVLNKMLPAVFQELKKTTEECHKERKKSIEEEFKKIK